MNWKNKLSFNKGARLYSENSPEVVAMKKAVADHEAAQAKLISDDSENSVISNDIVPHETVSGIDKEIEDARLLDKKSDIENQKSIETSTQDTQ